MFRPLFCDVLSCKVSEYIYSVHVISWIAVWVPSVDPSSVFGNIRIGQVSFVCE